MSYKLDQLDQAIELALHDLTLSEEKRNILLQHCLDAGKTEDDHVEDNKPARRKRSIAAVASIAALFLIFLGVRGLVGKNAADQELQMAEALKEEESTVEKSVYEPLMSDAPLDPYDALDPSIDEEDLEDEAVVPELARSEFSADESDEFAQYDAEISEDENSKISSEVSEEIVDDMAEMDEATDNELESIEESPPESSQSTVQAAEGVAADSAIPEESTTATTEPRLAKFDAGNILHYNSVESAISEGYTPPIPSSVPSDLDMQEINVYPYTSNIRTYFSGSSDASYLVIAISEDAPESWNSSLSTQETISGKTVYFESHPQKNDDGSSSSLITAAWQDDSSKWYEVTLYRPSDNTDALQEVKTIVDELIPNS